jgi:hypothetical protein
MSRKKFNKDPIDTNPRKVSINTVTPFAKVEETPSKQCSLEDIGNILVSSAEKAGLIEGVATIGIMVVLGLPNIASSTATGVGAAFVSFAIREYATKCQVNTQYLGGIVGGAVKYSIKGGNPIIGSINNLGYEVCNYYNLNPYGCAYTVEIGEELLKVSLSQNANLYAASKVGLVVGTALSFAVGFVYVPYKTYTSNAVNSTTPDGDLQSSNNNSASVHPINDNVPNQMDIVGVNETLVDQHD